MNNMIYVGIVIVVLIVAAVFLLGGHPSSPTGSTGTTGTTGTGGNTSSTGGTGASSQPTTSVASYTTVNPYNTTTTVVPSNLTNSSAPSGCTAAKYYSCGSFSISASKISATIGQTTGLNWSSYGVAYAPAGTKMSSGSSVPTGITFYTANASSTSNVGTSLPTGGTAQITLPGSNTLTGSIWVCYVNSGLVYVGNGCVSNGGGAGVPQYVEVATVNG